MEAKSIALEIELMPPSVRKYIENIVQGKTICDLDPIISTLRMIKSVDGSVSSDGYRAQVGDSFIITDLGYETITHYPKSIDPVIIG